MLGKKRSCGVEFLSVSFIIFILYKFIIENNYFESILITILGETAHELFQIYNISFSSSFFMFQLTMSQNKRGSDLLHSTKNLQFLSHSLICVGKNKARFSKETSSISPVLRSPQLHDR